MKYRLITDRPILAAECENFVKETTEYFSKLSLKEKS